LDNSLSTIIEPGQKKRVFFRELWNFRELFYFLSWKDILVRYKQTILGILWSILRPFLTMVVFSFVFGRLAKMPSEGIPYPVIVFVAMLPWQFFANALTETSGSLITNVNLISKVYFPRMIIPVSKVIVSLIDFFISFILLIILMFWYNCLPSWHIILLPLLLFIIVLFSLGSGLWLSALNVKYRDFRYIVPFIVQLGLYISPVGFSSQVIPEKWRLLFSINPMVGVIDGFRWALLGGKTSLYIPGLFISFFLVLVIFIGGFFYFLRMERSFADVI